MCNFFSAISNGKGKIYYADWKLRKQILDKKISLNPDSHASLAEYFKLNEDKSNKYEYNPLLKSFTVDQQNTTDDRRDVEEQCRGLNFKKIIPALIIKNIVHPFIMDAPTITDKQIILVKEWASVWASVRAYYGTFLKLKRKDWKYTDKIKTKGYPFAAAVKLWEQGLVPSFDGKTWRLHSSKGIVWQMEVEELKKFTEDVE